MTGRSFTEQWVVDASALCRHLLRYCLIYLTGAVILLLLLKNFSVGFNVSSSLPYRIAIIDKTAYDYKRGDIVVYQFHGTDPDYGGGLHGQWFFKRMSGIAGDLVSVSDRNVFVNSEYMGMAKLNTHDRKPLSVITPGAIPTGFFYAQGDHPDSFDSRYAQSGLIPLSRVVGRAHVLF